jgi:hypothetical protein
MPVKQRAGARLRSGPEGITDQLSDHSANIEVHEKFSSTTARRYDPIGWIAKVQFTVRRELSSPENKNRRR